MAKKVKDFMTKDDFRRRFLKFWDDYVGNMWDYNSLDILFKNGDLLKFYIFPYEKPNPYGCPLPGVCFTYQGEGYVAETPGLFVPALLKTKMGKWILETLDEISKNVDIENLEIDNIYENVIKY